MIYNIPFRLKAILGIAFIESILVISLIATGLSWLRSTNEAELRKRTQDVAQVLAVTSKDAVSANDIVVLNNIVKKIIKNKNIAHVEIGGIDGSLVKASRAKYSENIPNQDANAVEYLTVRNNITDNGKVYGYVKLGVSTSHITQIMDLAYRTAAGIGVAGMLLSALFSWLLGTYFAARLSRLRAASKKIEDGELGYQVIITGNDGLAKTSQAFNTMSLRVKELYDELSGALEKSRKMNKIIREKEIYTNAVLNSITDVIVTTDKRGNIETVNKAIVETFGYTLDEVIGENISILMPGTISEEHDTFINKYNKKDKNERKDLIVMARKRNLISFKKDGSEFPVEVIAIPIELNNEIIFVGMITDITARNTTEKELIHARQEAESANKAKSEFLANMSHEIRTPMNGVVGMLQVLNKTMLNEKQKKFVTTAISSADLLLNIINDILDFSKIEANKFNLDITDFDIIKVIEETAELLNQTKHDKNIKISCSIGASVPDYVSGDSIRLRQILINLGGNAIKFTEQGEISILVELIGVQANIYYIRFEIKDTGIGISAEQQNKLFKPFQQEDGSTSRRFGGSGLGLSICKYLVECMGGRIGLDSTPGQGSTFWFNICLDVAETSNTAPIGFISRKNVLILNDKKTKSSVIRVYLEEAGVNVHETNNLRQAIKKIDRILTYNGDCLDAIFLDMRSPNIDGIETAKIIHGNEKTSHIPIILINSSIKNESIPVESGITLCISEAVRKKHFIDRVSKIVCDKENGSDEVPGNKDQVAINFDAKIMLVEDNIINQEVAIEMLDFLGITPVLASNGIEAVEIFKINNFDLVLMDCQMPIMDGYEASRLIRQYEKEEGLARTPILALTANAMTTDKALCVDAGMDDHIPKPVTDDFLQKMLQKWLMPNRNESNDNMAEVDAPIKTSRKQHQYVDDLQYFSMYKKLGKRYLSILEKYKKNSLHIIENIKMALVDDDLNSIALHAHTLKGSSGSMAAICLRNTADMLEKSALSNDRSDMHDIVTMLQIEYEETIKAYDRLLDDTRKSA